MYFRKLLISLKIASNASVNPAKTRAETIDLMRYSFIHTNLIYLIIKINHKPMADNKSLLLFYRSFAARVL